ncbi:hypothetical protein Q3G72_026522 [Acer saccharum]|nr:hypothetical protein Q3G72_026522 [Acer saccharum]
MSQLVDELALWVSTTEEDEVTKMVVHNNVVCFFTLLATPFGLCTYGVILHELQSRHDHLMVMEKIKGFVVDSGGGDPSSPQCSLITLILSCTVADGVQFGWALQLSLLTPYIQALLFPTKMDHIFIVSCADIYAEEGDVTYIFYTRGSNALADSLAKKGAGQAGDFLVWEFS